MSNRAKYPRAKELLRGHLRTRYGDGSNLPSLKVLLDEFKVSQGTMERVLRDLTDEGLLKRFPGRGTFVSLNESPKKTRNIGFLWPTSQPQWAGDPYSARILGGVEEEAHLLDRHIIIKRLRDTDELTFFGSSEPEVAGILVLYNWDYRAVEAYLNRGIPVVLIDPFVRMAGVPFVTSDNYSATREETLYLARLGHKRIVHLTYQYHTSCGALPVDERTLGYREGMRNAGLDEYAHVELMPALKIPEWGEEINEEEQEDLIKFLDVLEQYQPTACVCFDSLLASWVIRVCQGRGIRVPDDMSVTGISDDRPLDHTWPLLTRIQLPLLDLGRAAMRILERQIHEKSLTGSGEILPVRLVEGASTKAVFKNK